MTTDIVGLETQPGQLLKLISNATKEMFKDALTARNATRTCGILVSMVMAHNGIDNMPLALLSNNVKSFLLTMNASDTCSSTKGNTKKGET